MTTQILATIYDTVIISSWVCFVCRGVDACGGRIKRTKQVKRTSSPNQRME